MSASSTVNKIAGVLGCVIGDANGLVLEHSTKGPEGDTLVAVTAFAGSSLSKAGTLLGIGAPQLLSVKSSGKCWVVGFHSGNVIVVECDAQRSATNVESTLAGIDWSALIESPIEDSELEYVPLSHQAGAKAKKGPEPLPSPQNKLELLIDDLPKAVLPPKPVVPRPQTSVARVPVSRTPPSSIQEAGARAHYESLQADLRRALGKGQLAQAETLSALIMEEAKKNNVEVDATPVPMRLLEGIASVLGGDAHGGLATLKLVEKSAVKAPSLRWAALIWCARASAGAGAGLDVANAYAQSALGLAGHLDTEARAVSTFELAEVVFHQGDSGEALELTHTARTLFSSTSDPQLLASCWLLEARVLAAIGNHQESISAAEHARDQRPSWPAPATFIARRALRDGRLRDAANALQPLLARKPTATEVERAHRVVEHVRAGSAPTKAAYEFLELADAPPTQQNIRQLEELSEAYPKIEQFRDTFGWQLLRAGQYESAAVVFERLSSRGDLAEEVRSSVLLALGCLAAVGSRHAKPGVKIRAAVDAAPKNFKSTKPTPPSSGKMRAAAPAEFRLSEVPPPSSVGAGFSVEEKRTSPRMVPGGPVFSGNLQLFALPDLLEFLRSGKRTGTLLCSSTAGIGAVHMRMGRVTGAASPKTKGLRDYLVAMGVVTPDALQKVEESRPEDKSLIGGILVKLGLVGTEQIRVALRDQVRDAIKELMSWGVGQFAFDPEGATDLSASDVDIEFDPQEVLLSIFKEMDETSK